MDIKKIGVYTLVLFTMVFIIINVFKQQAWISCAIAIFCIHIAVGYNAMDMRVPRNIWGVCAILSLVATVVLFIVN